MPTKKKNGGAPVMAVPPPAERRRFRARLLTWYRRHGRDLPWRKTDDPYHILVSEIMLQQTQVDRVLPKYAEWLGSIRRSARWRRRRKRTSCRPGIRWVTTSGPGACRPSPARRW